MKMNLTQKMTLSAILCALSIAIKSINFSFTYFDTTLYDIPIIISSVTMGPVVGLIVGVISDVTSMFFPPYYPFVPGYTISAALVGFIPGFVLYLMNRKVLNNKVAQIVCYVLFGLVGPGGAYFAYTYDIDLALWIRIVLMVLSFVVSACLIILTIYLAKKRKDQNSSFYKITLIVTIIELICYIGLAPVIYVTSFGGIYGVLLFSRIIRASFMIPFKGLILYYLFRALIQAKAIKDPFFINETSK